MPIAALFLAYLAGSIPFGLLLTKAAGVDIRAIGSGNIGATNVLRTGNKPLALLTLLLDGLKGYAAAWVGYEWGALAGYAILTSLACAVAAVAGHIFPVWLKFKGGKGVATAMGAFFGLSAGLGVLVAGLWLACFASTRYSSLSALVSLGSAPLLMLLFGHLWLLPATLPIGLLVVWRHRDNIQRLRHGTEPRFGTASAS